jgi:hypothetical protein
MLGIGRKTNAKVGTKILISTVEPSFGAIEAEKRILERSM